MNNAIEVLSELLKYLQEVLQRSKEGNKHNPELYLCQEFQTITLNQIRALSQAIQWGEALQSAEGELPRKLTEEDFLDIANPNRQATIGEFTYFKNGMNYFKTEFAGFNKAIDLCKHILAKKELRIRELEETFKKYGGQEVFKELATLKAELEEATTTIGDLRIKGFERLEYCKQLRQENANLKEEVETVRLESYGEALKNKKLRELLSEERILKTILKHLQEKVASGKLYLGTFWRDIAEAIAKGKDEK